MKSRGQMLSMKGPPLDPHIAAARRDAAMHNPAKKRLLKSIPVRGGRRKVHSSEGGEGSGESGFAADKADGELALNESF